MTTKAINCTSGDIFLVNKQEIGDRNLYNQTEETEDVESIMFTLMYMLSPFSSIKHLTVAISIKEEDNFLLRVRCNGLENRKSINSPMVYNQC